ncbi:MAG TPA: VWA domain-containing protein [Pyrinomonadaceae bacterium]|jgi:VWFA-related protein|nr:VWA domain-containing protein [Pyrinomonadaceae bacterium]
MHHQRFFIRPIFQNLLCAFVALLLCALAAGSARAQDDDDKVTVEANLIRLNVGVADVRGRAVTNLTRGDFAVFEDGVAQTILNFETTEQPFSLVLLLDMSGSTLSFRTQLKQSAQRFIDALSPADRVAVVSFWTEMKEQKRGVKAVDHIETLTSFTNDRARIAFAIDLARGGGDTNLYKALRYSLDALKGEGTRRKAIVVLTDGIDSDVRKEDRAATLQARTAEEAIATIKPDANSTLASVLNSADAQGVTIYPLALPSGDLKRLADRATLSITPNKGTPPEDIKHLSQPTPQQAAIYTAARARLDTLATRTGGRLHEINRLEDMARLYAEVAAEMRTLYTIAYQSANSRPRDGGWRAIQIQVARPELIARTRPGYYAR